MQRKALGIGVIGLGVHARRAHIDHFGALPAELVAVHDTDAAKMADFPRATAYGSEHDLLADPRVDAVMVMTPDRFHVGLAVMWASREKLVLTTCHPRRFDRPFLWLRDNLGRFREAFGDPLEFRFDFSYALPRPETAGNHRSLLLDHFGHEVDLMHFLFGRCRFDATRLFDSDDR
jgi:predicted dehydrogenase